MGEGKRKFDRLSPAEQQAVDITRKLANEGKLIAGGFAALVITEKIPLDAPYLPALRNAYMAGAEHLWSSIMASADPGLQETPGDMRRMELIQAEIDVWREAKLFAYAEGFSTKGSA